jgi:hypothetical protein
MPDMNELVAMLESEWVIKGEQSHDMGFRISNPVKTFRLAA